MLSFYLIFRCLYFLGEFIYMHDTNKRKAVILLLLLLHNHQLVSSGSLCLLHCLHFLFYLSLCDCLTCGVFIFLSWLFHFLIMFIVYPMFVYMLNEALFYLPILFFKTFSNCKVSLLFFLYLFLSRW